MRNKHFIIVLAVLCAVSAGSIISAHRSDPLTQFPEAATVAADSPSFDALSARFRAIATEKGASYAYDVLRHATLAPGTDLHLLGHEIGNVLYKQKGIDGMSICTHEFRNACSHAIVIGYMQEHGDGEDVRKAIDGACKKAPGGLGAYAMCYHGLGHGVFAYYGFTFPNTVKFCEQEGTADAHFVQRDECIGGAVMELIGGGGHDRDKWTAANARYFKKSDPLAPCSNSSIPTYAKTMCYVYITPHLVEWSGASFQNFTSEQITKAMDACAPLKMNSPERNACVGGFGKEFAGGVVGHSDSRLLTLGTYTDAQLKEVERLCTLATDPRDAHTCELYALGTFFWGGEAEKHLATRYCNVLSDAESRGLCFNDLAHRIVASIGNPTIRAARCELVDEAHRPLCGVRSHP